MNTFLDALVQSLPWAAALAGALIAALANGIETGLYRLNRIRLRLRAESGDRRAQILQNLVADLRGMIIVCLIGTNFGAFLATAVAALLVESAGWVRTDLGVELITTAIVTPLLFVFADVVPKSLFTAEADHWLYGLARPLRASYQALRGIGLVPVLGGLSNLILRVARKQEAEGTDPFHPRQRLRAILREGAAEGVITGYQKELVDRVLDLREHLVRDVMIPMGRAASVSAAVTREAFMDELRRLLAPGGVLLLGVPHVAGIQPWWHELWRFTPEGLAWLGARSFGAGNVTLRSYGNTLTAAGAMRGLIAAEFSSRELGLHDDRFAVEVCLRAVKA